MDKKLQLGCVGAIIIIVLATFTTVVGVYTSTSSSFKDSPLFNARAKQAINATDQETIVVNYIGKGKGGIIPLPKMNSKDIMVHKLIDAIGNMGDATFNRFIAFATARLRQDSTIKDANTDKIITALQLIRNNPRMANTLVHSSNTDYNNFNVSFRYPCTLSGLWVPGCAIISVILLIGSIIVSILFIIAHCFVAGHSLRV